MRLRSPPLFWRTFLLIVSLAVASLLAWVPTVRVFEREPRAHQLAEQIISLAHATRIALVYSDPERRRQMLGELADDVGLRVLPLEPADQIQALPDSPFLLLVENEVRQRLGPDTRLAAQVNGVPGFWVSFSIDDDAYWAFIDRDMLRREFGHGWIAWALLATACSLLAAIAIARLVNRPLAQLARAASDLGAGRVPDPLPETGPIELRAVNQSFNRMVSDLAKLDQDRAILLAGVSHDLRTPLTRMRLELEMNELPEASRAAMIADLEQMDLVIHQFLDYAMPVPQRDREDVDLSALVREVVARNRKNLLQLAGEDGGADGAGQDRLREEVAENIHVRGFRTELARTVENLLANAIRYGRGTDGHLDIEVALRRETDAVLLMVADHGPGIAAQDLARLVRPFERGESSRSGVWGAGLGLAIVDRVAQMHGAQLAYLANVPSGLRVELRLPLRAPDRPAPGSAPSG